MANETLSTNKTAKVMFLLGEISTSGVKAGTSTQCTKQKNKDRKRKRVDMGYFIDGIRVCRDAFLFIHMTSDKFFTKLVKHYIENGVEMIEEFGCHGQNNIRRFSREDTERAMTFLVKYAEDKSLCIPGRIPGIKSADPVYFLTARKCGIFGVHCEGLSQQVNFLVDEGMDHGKGPNS
ncbi:uncharacterized protein LOC117109344, partial [Anneissia japonica]|uniref:uncharacterized protein LOC117109344 n=1 Tax=Anneissia japonica TaxID=1529436 RepID=UPI001425AD85